MYSATTQTITVKVEPTFLDNQSAPDEDRYVWAYHVRIENNGSHTVQLIDRHWRITDWQGNVHEVRGEELPLPGALRDADGISQIAFLHVTGAEGWTRDDLHKRLRGYAHGPEALLGRGLIRECPGDRRRLEPVPALERAPTLAGEARSPLVDKIHLLLATIHGGERIEPLVARWPGQRPLLREGLSWLGRKEPGLRELAELTARSLEALGPDDAVPPEQLTLFSE